MIHRTFAAALLSSLVAAGCAASTEEPSTGEPPGKDSKQPESNDKTPEVKDGIIEPKFCKVYDQAEWFLLTGQNSEYGGTWCTRR
jgi:hypothetical protein